MSVTTDTAPAVGRGPDAPTVAALPPVRVDAALGAVASLPAAVVFGAAIAAFGELSTIAGVVRSDAPVVGAAVHLAVSTIVGAGLGLLVRRQAGLGGGLLWWSVVYAGTWWVLGALTALPVLSGAPPAWRLDDAQAQLPSLFGHLAWGLTTGLVLTAIRGERPRHPRTWPRAGRVLRAVLSGVVAAALLDRLLVAVGTSLLPTGVIDATLPTWATGGTRQSLLLAVPLGLVAWWSATGPTDEPLGPAVVRGWLVGLGWWVGVPLTILPLLAGDRPAWMAAQVREAVVVLPPLVIASMTAAVVCSLTGRVGRALFSDRIATGDEGPGAVGLRVLLVGTGAGLVGGLAFTVVLAGVGGLGRIAGLMGARSVAAGLALHLVIAALIGVLYVLLFRHHAPDAASAVGWGLAYGLVWWLLGAVTLLPVLLGEPPAWSAAAAAAEMPALVGHLVYGVGIALVASVIDARHSPWWVARRARERRRVQRRVELVRSSAPALWAASAGSVLLLILVVAP